MLVWTKAPLLFRNELVAVDELTRKPRAAEAGEVKRVGNDPVVLALASDGDARIESPVAGDDRGRALGPRWRSLRSHLGDQAKGAGR